MLQRLFVEHMTNKMGLTGLLDEHEDAATSSSVDLREQYENALRGPSDDASKYMHGGSPAELLDASDGAGGSNQAAVFLFFVFPIVGFLVLVLGAFFLKRRQVRQDAAAIRRYRARLSAADELRRMKEERRLRLVERALVTTRVILPKKGARGRRSTDTDETVATVDDGDSLASQRASELEGIDKEHGIELTVLERGQPSTPEDDGANFANNAGPETSSAPGRWDASVDWQNETCSICLERYLENDEVSWSKHRNCTHVFHTACITSWLRNELRNDCPYCRVRLVEDDAEYLGGSGDNNAAVDGTSDVVVVAEGTEPTSAEVAAESGAAVEGGDFNV